MDPILEQHSSQRVQGFHHNSSLLFQFVLSEFIEANPEVNFLKQFCLQIKSLPDNQSIKEHFDNHLKEMTAVLSKISGSSQDYRRTFFTDADGGILNTIRHYISLLLGQGGEQINDYQRMQRYLDKGNNYSLKGLDIIRLIKMGEGRSKREYLETYHSLHKAITQWVNGWNQMIGLAAQLLYRFRRDENVVLFVVRNHLKFEQCYGNQFKSKILGKMFPKGLPELQRFLEKKYVSRGFENVLPLIAKTMNQYAKS